MHQGGAKEGPTWRRPITVGHGFSLQNKIIAGDLSGKQDTLKNIVMTHLKIELASTIKNSSELSWTPINS